MLLCACGPKAADTPSTTPTETTESAKPDEPAAKPEKCTFQVGAPDSDAFLVQKHERIGGLAHGASPAEVKKALGEPTKVEGPVENAVEGGMDYEWKYDDKGVSVTMWSETGPDAATLRSMTPFMIAERSQ